ncbi:ABC transporter permease [Phytomonospora endophytica]|uniref:Putative aldouronate transport system permease protein n=1 Tax=Phytomonospora endophytica TaxID=714109 RepID=A0A841F9R9_9ACTN|nr:ABC transporter permease subunit [Phytomonospora endophytica]MBB6032996.1 putative aldouronate transport system permease protein [Phytomonospora endophytica]
MSVETETPAVTAKEKPKPRPRRKLTLVQRLKRDKVMILLAAPGLLYFLVFHYLPMLGNIVAFQDYQPYLGFLDSDWIGLENFTDAFADPRFWSAVTNTLVIALVQLVFFFPAPIALALLLNSVLSSKIRRFVQSVVYLPHFIGWVIIVSIFQQLLGAAGLLPNVLDAIGLPRYDMMTDPDAFPWLVTLQLVWKDMGWGTIIFLAALLSIDPQLYEAAAVDGASRWRRLWHVTLPGITPIIILLLILNLGNILSVGFEQLILQRDNVGAAAGEVLDTYVYFNGIQNGEWGPSAAIGIVKAIFGTALILGANKLAHFFGHEGIYRGADK